MLGQLTGSRVYGTPKEDSDVDMILRVTRAEGTILEEVSGAYRNPDYPDTKDARPIRFGKLNIILCYTDAAYEGWLKARQLCMENRKLLGRQLTREEAVAIHKMCEVK